jgi:hypothetical protein
MKMLYEYVEETAKKYAECNSHDAEPPAAYSSWKGKNKATYIAASYGHAFK